MNGVNSLQLTLLCPEWGSNPIPSDPQSEPIIDCATGSGSNMAMWHVIMWLILLCVLSVSDTSGVNNVIVLVVTSSNDLALSYYTPFWWYMPLQQLLFLLKPRKRLLWTLAHVDLRVNIGNRKFNWSSLNPFFGPFKKCHNTTMTCRSGMIKFKAQLLCYVLTRPNSVLCKVSSNF
jgi:hypothetical protein